MKKENELLEQIQQLIEKQRAELAGSVSPGLAIEDAHRSLCLEDLIVQVELTCFESRRSRSVFLRLPVN